MNWYMYYLHKKREDHSMCFNFLSEFRTSLFMGKNDAKDILISGLWRYCESK